MKKIIIPILVLAVSACTREMPESPFPGMQKEITIQAYAGAPDTKTERASDGAVLWSPGDEISVFYGSGTDGGSKFTAQNTESAKVTNFTGSVSVVTGGNEISAGDTHFWAVYPYNPAASCDGKSVTTVLPSVQNAVAGTFADDLFPALGHSDGLSMPFFNICGGIKFTLSQTGIKSVTLKGCNGEILAGTINVGLDEGGRPVVNNITDGSETITLTAPEGGEFEVGKAYYIVLVPTEFVNGFMLTFAKEDLMAAKFRFKSTSIKRSVFGFMATPDKDLQWGEDIEIPEYVPIPDANFRDYLVQNFDTNGNGVLDFGEAEAVTELNFNTDEIYSLSGIEYMTNLSYLRCSGSTSVKLYDAEGNLTGYDGGTGCLTALDVSKNTALTYLYCNNNKITTLDISQNTLLNNLYCGYNLLSDLDVSNNTSLTRVYCYGNQLTNLNVSGCSALTYLSCYRNNLQALNVSGCDALYNLSCYNNQLTSLDVSTCINLSTLSCYNNQLASLDVRNYALLKYLRCYNNQLTSLKVSGCENLSTISCYNNQLTALDLSGVAMLNNLECNSNQLASLDVSHNTELTSLYCGSNQLTTLSLINNRNLQYVDVIGNLALAEIWLAVGQTLSSFNYDPAVTTIKYNYPSGLSDVPVVVSTADELMAFFANPVYDVELGADIDMSGRNIPAIDSYAGRFDGKGHTLKGISSCKPLFSEFGGWFKDVIFDQSCSFTPDVPVFGIVAGVNTGIIENVTSSSPVSYTVASIPDPVLIAAIAGQSSGMILNCVNEGAVSIVSQGPVTGLGVAGIVAYQSSSLSNCINRGAISFEAPNISSKATVVDAANALPSVGGVSAIGAPGFLMENCHNYGKVSYRLYAAETDMTANLSRNQIGGVVSSPCGAVRKCNNYGEVNVSLKHSTPGTNLPYEFIACVGGIGGGDYLFTSSSGPYFNTSYYDCVNEGTVIVDCDAYLSNTAVGGIVGWPGQEKSNSGYAENCVNRGTIIGRGVMKCRIGGVEGGTGCMYKCSNEGTVILESGNVESAIGSLCGFHSQSQYIESCTAGGEVKSMVANQAGGVSGFIGNVGNMANYTAYGCKVNCKITVATYDPQTVGMVVGKYNGTTREVVLGDPNNPIEVSGSINGTPASSSNIYGLMNDSNHTIYYVIK